MLTAHDIVSLAQELAELLYPDADEIEHLIDRSEGEKPEDYVPESTVVMTSIGYVELHPDGEIIGNGQLLHTLDPESCNDGPPEDYVDE